MQTLIQTAVACIKIVIDKQCFLFPCWSCNVLLFCSCCTTPLSLPLPSLLFLSVHLVLNYPSSPFRLPSSIFTPSTPLASFLPSLTPPFHHLCLFAFASSTPHFSFPFSLCRPRCLQSDTAPYSSGKVFFLLFTQSVCQFVSLSFIIALLHEPAQSHLSLLPFWSLHSHCVILVIPSSLTAYSLPTLLLFLLHIWLLLIYPFTQSSSQ